MGAMQRKTQNLQTFAVKGSALGFLIVGLLIFLGSLFPFYSRLKHQEEPPVLLEHQEQILPPPAEESDHDQTIHAALWTTASILMGVIAIGASYLVLMIRPLMNQMQAEILERQKAETALRKEKDFTQTLFNANPAFFIVLDADGKVQLMNDMMLKTLGYNLEEIKGTDYTATFVPRRNGDSLPWVFELMIQRRLPIRTEERILTKDGQELIVEWHGRAIFNEETDEYEYFVGAGLDITERKRAEEELLLLQRITKEVSVACNFESALEVALRLVCETIGWEFGEAWVPHPYGKYLECSPIGYNRGENLEEFQRLNQQYIFQPNQSLTGRIYSSQQPEWIFDIEQESPDHFTRKEIAIKFGLKAGFGVPIVVDHEVLVVLIFFTITNKPEDKRLLNLISSIATQLGTVFQRKQAEAKYRSIFENAVEGIFQISRDGEYIRVNPAFATILGYLSPDALTGDNSFIREVFVNHQDFYQMIDLLNQHHEISNFEAQVYRHDHSVIWIFANVRAILDGKKQHILYYEGSIVDITSFKQTEEKLRYSASHDSLTTLWNRAFFVERLQQAIIQCQEQPGYHFSVLFLDLDGFKFINDSLGHGSGDQLLIAIAKRLKTCLRNQDILARLGGDEFTILLENVGFPEEVKEIAERVQQSLKKPFNLNGNQIFTGSSIGIVHSSSEYLLPSEVLRDADTAMYRAKQQGKGCYVVFDATMRTDALRRLQLQTDLRWAIEKNQFKLHYQPIINLENGAISGFEALLRWEHPQEGFISPAEFIPVAEEAGLIVDIGEWVLRQACRQLREWKQKFNCHPQLRMSVNLSGQQFTSDLSQKIDRILTETEVMGSDLKLEITETAIMSDPQLAIATLNELKHREIKLCIDDFGTGYCSLGYLHQFPVDVLKIDRSFVSQMFLDENKRELVKVIVALAHSLGMDAIAEGIESQEQLYQLKSLECQYGQGYYFSQPLNPQEAERLLNQSSMAEKFYRQDSTVLLKI
ncbi:EAL domain-containing protein [Planktothrix sp. FACHB-1365]|nr:EAL domain-containing protein [Planktothrix sp. FACHB-1365]